MILNRHILTDAILIAWGSLLVIANPPQHFDINTKTIHCQI
jgi:hypothetical protein